MMNVGATMDQWVRIDRGTCVDACGHRNIGVMCAVVYLRNLFTRREIGRICVEKYACLFKISASVV